MQTVFFLLKNISLVFILVHMYFILAKFKNQYKCLFKKAKGKECFLKINIKYCLFSVLTDW